MFIGAWENRTLPQYVTLTYAANSHVPSVLLGNPPKHAQITLCLHLVLSAQTTHTPTFLPNWIRTLLTYPCLDYVCVDVCLHGCLHTHRHVHTHTEARVHTHTQAHVRTYVCACTHTNREAYVRTPRHMHTHGHMRAHTSTCTHTHGHMHTHNMGTYTQAHARTHRGTHT